MQINALRGSVTVTSLRLCSRAPWTTSSSAGTGASVPSEHVFVQANFSSRDGATRPRRQPDQALRRRTRSSSLVRARAPSGLPLRNDGHRRCPVMGQTARRTAVAALVALGVLVLALAFWKLRLVIALLFAG